MVARRRSVGVVHTGVSPNSEPPLPSLALRIFDRVALGRHDLRTMSHAEVAALRDQRLPEDLPVVGPAVAALGRRILGTPHPDVITTDEEVEGAAGLIPLRVHTPRVRPADAPLVVHLHGGGWVLNRPVMYDHLCTTLAAELGAVVASVDYRKAPEDPAPAAVDDALVATGALLDEAPDRFATNGTAAVVGDSAGGNLAALVALARRDDDRLRAQWLIYPAVDLARTFDSHRRHTGALVLPKDSIDQFLTLYVGDADPTDPHISPWYAEEVGGSAPALVQVAELDPLVDEGLAWAARLEDAGVETRVTTYVDQPHGFHAVPGLVGAAADQATAEGITFLRRHLC